MTDVDTSMSSVQVGFADPLTDSEYLPEYLSDDQVAKMVEKLIAALGETPEKVDFKRANDRRHRRAGVEVGGFSQNFDVNYIHELMDQYADAGEKVSGVRDEE